MSFIIRKDRRRKKEEHLQQQHHAHINQELVGIPSTSMTLVPTNNNTNWYLKEKPHEFQSQTTLPRTSGDEPFVVGPSIVRYSGELDRSTSYNYRPSTAEKYVANQRNLPVRSHSRTEAPNEAETRMVRLGMIPPRPTSANGHIPVGYSTEPARAKSQKGKNGKRKSTELEETRKHNEDVVRSGMIPPRPMSANGHIQSGYYTEPGKNKSPKGKGGKRKSRELEDSGRYKGEILVPLGEVQLWPLENASNHSPYPLPKEDYDTDGATWYYARATDGQSLASSRSESGLHPPSATENYQRQDSQNANGRIVAPSLQRDASPTAAKVMEEPFHADQDPDKLKRVRRVGVPILPE